MLKRTERPNYIDYAKVIMIYLVVLGHYTYAIGLGFKSSAVWNIMHFITLFHMPFFFIVSGFLFKMLTPKETVKKGWIQLIRPYLVMSVISCIIMIAIDSIIGVFNLKRCAKLAIGILTGYDAPWSLASWSSPLWFCYALFIVKLIASCLNSMDKRIMYGGGILLIITSVLVLYNGNIVAFRLDSSLIGLFFFLVGFLAKDIIEKMVNLNAVESLFLILLLVILLIVSAYVNLDLDQRQGLSINACYFGEYPLLFLLSGICGSALVLVIMSFVKIISKPFNKFILQISNGTIIILGFHWLVYKLVFSFWLSSYSTLVAIISSFINLVICYCIILLSNKYFPVLLGNRKLN